MEELKEEFAKFDVVSRFNSLTSYWDRVSLIFSFFTSNESDPRHLQMWIS